MVNFCLFIYISQSSAQRLQQTNSRAARLKSELPIGIYVYNRGEEEQAHGGRGAETLISPWLQHCFSGSLTSQNSLYSSIPRMHPNSPSVWGTFCWVQWRIHIKLVLSRKFFCVLRYFTTSLSETWFCCQEDDEVPIQ